MRTARIGALALAGAAAATMAFAQDADRAIAARQAHMTLFSHNFGPIFMMARERMDYDPEVAQTAADNLAALAAVDQWGYWPEGSDAESVDGTKALPAIWENMDDFWAHRDALIEATATLAEGAGTDLATLQAGFGQVGAACNDCHEDYRESD